MANSTGKILIVAGAILIAAGILFLFKDSLPFIKHLGRLPGDINIQGKNFSLHFPIVTGIIISLILSLILYVLGRLK